MWCKKYIAHQLCRAGKVGLVCSVLLFIVTGCYAGFWAFPLSFNGQTEEQVLAAKGEPTTSWELPDGNTRLQYSGQPWGRYVWNYDLDASGTVVAVYQALDEANFARVPVDGSWGVDAVLREFGSPAFVTHVASWQGDIWVYRWAGLAMDMYFYVYFDTNHQVRRAETGIDYTKENYNDLR